MDLKTICAKGTAYAVRQRIGRGVGTGKGKTSGRGHKGRGQRSGASRRPGYEGGQMPIYRRVPKRGFTNARFRTDHTVINVGALSAFESGATVDLAAVLDHGLGSKTSNTMKVLGGGELSVPLTVRAQKFTASARQKIEAAGGAVVVLDSRGREAGAAKAESKPEATPAEAKPGESPEPDAPSEGENPEG